MSRDCFASQSTAPSGNSKRSVTCLSHTTPAEARKAEKPHKEQDKGEKKPKKKKEKKQQQDELQPEEPQRVSGFNTLKPKAQRSEASDHVRPTRYITFTRGNPSASRGFFVSYQRFEK